MDAWQEIGSVHVSHVARLKAIAAQIGLVHSKWGQIQSSFEVAVIS